MEVWWCWWPAPSSPPPPPQVPPAHHDEETDDEDVEANDDGDGCPGNSVEAVVPGPDFTAGVRNVTVPEGRSADTTTIQPTRLQGRQAPL